MKQRATTALKNQYKQILQFARAKQSSEPVSNLYPWHCELAVTELMRHANSLQERQSTGSSSTVRILTGTCPEHVYGNGAYEEFRTFLEKGGILKVLAWSATPSKRTSKLAMLCDQFKSNAELRVSKTVEKANEIPHFLLVGEAAYRFEAPHEFVPAESFSDFYPEVPARICFNDPSSGSELKRFFDDIWGKCHPVE